MGSSQHYAGISTWSYHDLDSSSPGYAAATKGFASGHSQLQPLCLFSRLLLLHSGLQKQAQL